MFNSTWVDQWSGAGISDNEVIDRGVLKPYHVSRCNQTGGAHIYLEATSTSQRRSMIKLWCIKTLTFRLDMTRT